MAPKVIVEQHLLEHPRVKKLLLRMPRARVLTCRRYTEVFNPKSQNFRLQKKNPAWIIAEKNKNLVLPAPSGFGIGGVHNYYFSHLLNCPYDCRYCFLQGMYRSANYVWFINYEDYWQAISDTIAQDPDQTHYFFSGYDGDSLALDPVTDFVSEFVPFFSQQKKAVLELRTKSTNVRSLLRQRAADNVVVAFSFTPARISQQVEHKVPPLDRRIEAMAQVARAGWPIGLRFDPLIDAPDFASQYRQLMEDIFCKVSAAQIHSISFGPLRFPAKMLDRIIQYYPEEPLLASVPAVSEGEASYGRLREQQLLLMVKNILLDYVEPEKYFSCYSAEGA